MPTMDEQLVLAISADLTNLRRAVTEMGGVVKKMTSDQTKFFDAVGGSANSSADKVIAASRRQSAGVTSEARKSAAAVAEAHSRAAANAANSARNLTFQINDVLSGLASGGGMRAVAQQFGQIAQVFAFGGGAGSGIASTLKAMVTSGNLVTIALIAASAAATYLFSNMEDGAEKAQEKFDKLIDGIESFANKLKVITPKQSDTLLEFTFTINSEKMIKEMQGAVDDLNARLKADVGKLKIENIKINEALEFDTADQYKLLALFDDLEKALDRNQPGIVEATKLYDALLNLQFDEPNSGAGQLAISVKSLIEGLKRGWDVGNALRGMIDAVNAANIKTIENQEKYNKALAKMQGIGVPTLTEMEQLMKTYAEAIAVAADEMARLAAESELAAGIQRLHELDMSEATGDTADFIKKRESFRANAYWDVNAYRVGYGSDTFVDANNMVKKVTADTVTTVERATKDLQRRLGEFQDVIRRQIGGETFEGLAEDQKKALTSIAYNYGDLPDSIVKAIKTGDHGQVARAIEALGSDNAGVNRNRRSLEARVYAGATEEGEAALGVGELTEAQKKENDQEKERLRLSGLLTKAYDEETYKKVYAAELSAGMAAAEEAAAKRGTELTQKEKDEVTALAEAKAKLAAQEEGANKAREAAETYEGRLQALRDENELLAQKASQLGLTTEALIATLDPTERQTALNEANNEVLKIEQALREKNIVLTNAQRAALSAEQQTISLGKAALNDYGDTQKSLAKDMEKLNEQFANVFQSAISGFISDLRRGVDAGEAFSNMLDRIIDGLINMALEMLFSKELLGGLFGIGGGLGGGGGGSILSSILEKGGVVGDSANPTRRADPSWWKGAPSFATGGMVKPPGAIPILAHAGEIVVPRNQVKGLGQMTLTNNVGDISIDMAESGAVVSSTQDGRALGKQIQAAVQVVLVQESRPGGLLRKGA